jgi:hypothetical protein
MFLFGLFEMFVCADLISFPAVYAHTEASHAYALLRRVAASYFSPAEKAPKQSRE